MPPASLHLGQLRDGPSRFVPFVDRLSVSEAISIIVIDLSWI